jgi:hypothetical protein
MDTSLLASLIALVVALGGIITALATRKKNAAEASDLITESAMKLLAPLNKRIEALEKLTEQQEKELEILRPLPAIVETMSRGIHILIEQIREWGEEPRWTPTDMLPTQAVLKRKDVAKKLKG